MKPTLLELSAAGNPEREAKLKWIALSVEGVRGVHQVRCRQVGSSSLADLHILVAPEMTVRDSHALSHRVRRAILDAIPEVTDVVIHVEPFNGGPLP